MRPTPQRVQLHRALSKAGLASRTEAAKAIRAGQVRVNGRVILDPLAWVSLGTDRILLAGQQAPPKTGMVKHRHLLLHKPRVSVVTRSDDLCRLTVHAGGHSFRRALLLAADHVAEPHRHRRHLRHD